MKTKMWKVIVITLTGLLIIGSGGCGQAPENFEEQYMAQAFVRCDDLELIKEEVEDNDFNLNKEVRMDDGKKYYPLYLTQIEEYKPRFIEYLLKNGANPDKAFGDKTMLMILSGVGQTVAESNLANLLIENGADVNKKTKSGKTALDYAASSSSNYMINILLENNAKISKTTLGYAYKSDVISDNYIAAHTLFTNAEKQNIKFDKDPMYEAAVMGDTDKLIALVKENNGEYTSRVPFFAAAYCKPAAIEYFETIGFESDSKDGEDNDILWIATASGNVEVIDYLKSKGYSFNTKSYDTFDSDPIKIAIQNNQYEAVNALLKNGAAFNINKDLGYDGEDGDSANYPMEPMDSVQAAAMNGNLEMLNLLFDNGYPLNKNTLYRGLKIALDYNQTDTIEYLLKKGADPNYADNRFSDNYAPVEICALYGTIDGLKLLHKYGANINQGDSNFLKSAVDSGQTEMVKYLLDNGMDVNAAEVYEDGSNTVPLEDAKYDGYLDIIKLLIENGADINDKKVAFIVNIAMGSNRILNYLIESGADVNLKDSAGMTALMTAAINHREQNVKDLLRAGANADIKDSEGKTALDYAKDSKDKGIIKLLENAQ